MPKMLYPKTREAWLELRQNYVSSTESAALFSMSPYLTAYELAVIKDGKSTDNYEGNERTKWGLALQRVIAESIAQEYGVRCRAISGYAVSTECPKMGASFDFEIIGRSKEDFSGDGILRDLYAKHGAGVLEIKNVDTFVFKNEWEKQDDGDYEAPGHIELQVQHQLECIGREWAAIGVLVGGNRQVLLTRSRDIEVGEKIRGRVDAFYADLAAGTYPPISLPADADIIRSLYKYAEPGKVLDYQKEVDEAGSKILDLVAAHAANTVAKSAAEEAHKSSSAALLMAIGDTEKVLFDGFSVSAGTVAPTWVERYERKGYRNLRVYVKKPKKDKNAKPAAKG